MIEIKCPIPKDIDYKLPVQYNLPVYYVLQILAELKAHGCQTALFVSYSAESTVVHCVRYDGELFDKVESKVQDIFSSKKPKAKVNVSDNLREIRDGIKSFVKSNVTLIGEFPSLTMLGDQNESIHASPSPYVFNTLTSSNLSIMSVSGKDIHDGTVPIVESAHTLARRKASDILAFVLADTDREYDPAMYHDLPIAYNTA